MTVYRKKKGKDVWHWCKNCSNFPTSDYTEESRTSRPTNGELCNECIGKEKNNNCH